jgi:hypothetical protein
MGLARNLSKFKPNSDGLVEASDLGFTLSSEALSKTFPLKTSTTLTAGRAVNINSSGEVGDYPVINTLGTVVSNPTIGYAEISGGYESQPYYQGWISTDGSRTLTPYITLYESPFFQLRGTALTSSGATVGSLTTFTTGSLVYASNMSCIPLNETQFLVCASHTNTGGGGSTTGTFTWTVKVITVDSSGNISQGTAATFTGEGAFWYTKANILSRLSDGKIGIYAVATTTSGSTNVSRIATVSGTSVSLTSDSDYAFLSVKNSYLTASNKLLGVFDGTLYVSSYDGSTTSSPTSTVLTTNRAEGTNANGVLFSSNHAAIVYQQSNANVVLETFSINQTTGSPTLVTSRILGTPAGSFNCVRMIAINSTDAVVAYKTSSTTTLLSFKIDSSGALLGTGTPLVLATNTELITELTTTATSNVIRYIYNSTTGRSNDATINSYNTPSWTTVGATATSQTTSPATVVVGGVCGGFTGLTAGLKYYVNETTYSGQVTATAGNYLLGTAISSTEILLG